MKHLLLSLVVIPCLAWGQIPDSLSASKEYWENKIILIDRQPPKQDTIRCLMLVCDTSFIKNMSTEIRLNDYFYSIGNRYASLWWQFGYEIREPYREYALLYPYKSFYLDENKKQLSKSIVVWQTKEIKQ